MSVHLLTTVQHLTTTQPDLVRGVLLWAQGDGLMGCLVDRERKPIMASSGSVIGSYQQTGCFERSASFGQGRLAIALSAMMPIFFS